MIFYLRNGLSLQIEGLERRYRQLSIEYEQLRSEPKINYSEYEVRYSSVCALSVYYSNHFFRVNFQEKRSLQTHISELELELQRANGQIKVSFFVLFHISYSSFSFKSYETEIVHLRESLNRSSAEAERVISLKYTSQLSSKESLIRVY